MRRLMGWALKGFAAILFLSMLISIPSMLESGGTSGLAFLPLLLLGGVGGGLWYWSGAAERREAKRALSVEAMSREAEEFLTRVNEARAFPPALSQKMISTADRPLLLVTPARLLELKTLRSTTHIGTRVKLGGVPIVLGKSTPVSRTEMAEAAEGELALTADRLVFSGGAKTADVQLTRVAAVELSFDGITVTVTGRVRPLFFSMENPLLWSLVLKNVAGLGMQGRDLPSGRMLQVM